MTHCYAPLSFKDLLPTPAATHLRAQLGALINASMKTLSDDIVFDLIKKGYDNKALQSSDDDYVTTEWLIQLFNQLFILQNTQLVRGDHEPEYFAATPDDPARIEFAHGFFASALHELSHWCIAGSARRCLNDFGYWYAPDGRTEAQQHAFERVEIKPQALECLFTRACKRDFRVSQDNLFADFDTHQSTFASDVYAQADSYITHPNTIPRDAKILLYALLTFFNAS